MRPGPTTADVLALAMALDVGSSRHPFLTSTASSTSWSLLVAYLWINITNEILVLAGIVTLVLVVDSVISVLYY